MPRIDLKLRVEKRAKARPSYSVFRGASLKNISCRSNSPRIGFQGSLPRSDGHSDDVTHSASPPSDDDGGHDVPLRDVPYSLSSVSLMSKNAIGVVS